MEKYNEYKDSGVQWLGEIPSHWKMKRLASMFVGEVEINKKYRIKRAFKFNYGDLVPKNEVGDLEEYKNVYTKYSLIKKGDIIINGLNLNYDFVSQRVACTPDEGIITSAYVVCRPRKKVNYNFYTYLFKGMDSMKLFHGMGAKQAAWRRFARQKKKMRNTCRRFLRCPAKRSLSQRGNTKTRNIITTTFCTRKNIFHTNTGVFQNKSDSK